MPERDRECDGVRSSFLVRTLQSDRWYAMDDKQEAGIGIPRRLSSGCQPPVPCVPLRPLRLEISCQWTVPGSRQDKVSCGLRPKEGVIGSQ